jgi:hypothetical protein
LRVPDATSAPPLAEHRDASWRVHVDAGNQRSEAMPVIILWAVPAVFVLGGVTYLLVK